MKTTLLSILLLSISILPSLSYAELDLDREVINIPDTHDTKPYIWNVKRDPKGYELLLQHDDMERGASRFLLEVKGQSGTISDMQVFITDEDLHTFEHLRPQRNNGGKYPFSFAAAKSAKYRFEIVFKSDNGWVDLRKDIKLQKADGKDAAAADSGDEDYAVDIKLYPKKIYAEHVGTFLYKISYKGKPLNGLQKLDGSDMQVAAWDEDLKEFVYATPKQNLGGPEVAVSIVFRRPGKHAVFAEFKHNGVVRKIDSVINVLEEPTQFRESPIFIRPAE